MSPADKNIRTIKQRGGGDRRGGRDKTKGEKKRDVGEELPPRDDDHARAFRARSGREKSALTTLAVRRDRLSLYAAVDPAGRRSSPIHERDVIAQEISPSRRRWLSDHFP